MQDFEVGGGDKVARKAYRRLGGSVGMDTPVLGLLFLILFLKWGSDSNLRVSKLGWVCIFLCA